MLDHVDKYMQKTTVICTYIPHVWYICTPNFSHNQCSKTWDRKCLALIAQMVRAFGMNPKVGGSSPVLVETFSVSKTFTLSQEHPFVCRKWMLVPAHSSHFKILALLKKNTPCVIYVLRNFIFINVKIVPFLRCSFFNKPSWNLLCGYCSSDSLSIRLIIIPVRGSLTHFSEPFQYLKITKYVYIRVYLK